MADELEDRAARLAGNRKKKGANVPALTAVALVSGLGLGGAGVYYALSNNDLRTGPDIPTSETQEFQVGGTTGLTDVPGRPTFAPTGPSENELALRDRVAELERLLKDAEGVTRTETVVDDTQLQALRDELDGLKTNLQTQSDEMAALAAERDAERRDKLRLQAEYEGLQLALSQAEDDTLAEQMRLEEEARKRQELERRRQEAIAINQRQINSPIGGISKSEGSGEERDYTGDEAFLRAGSDRIKVTQSQVIGAPSNTIVQGTIIEATLTTGINSALSGTITATTSYDVWSFDMNNVLIPRGSQLFGRYSNEIALGQRRALVAWDRVVTPDGQVVSLDAYGSDRLGRSGLTGRVNNRFLQRFGSAALISVVGAIPILAASNSDSEAANEVAENVSSDLEDNVSSVVQQYLSLAPIITVEHGEIINIMVSNDLELF